MIKMKEEIKLSERAKGLKLGIYEHYKGGKYEVLGVALHSETLEEMVVYQHIGGDEKFWVRPLEMFLENVEIEGVIKPRFTFISDKLIKN